MVSLRDGKSYDPAVEASGGGGGSRRRSTANASTPSQRPTRRSARLASASTADENDNNVPFQTPQDGGATPSRNKRQRPQQLTVVAEPAGGMGAADSDDDYDELDTCDIGATDQGLQQALLDAADTELPADEPSPSAMHAHKKPRIPRSRTPTPSKAAAAASKLRRETATISIAAAFMVLVAAVAIAGLLPQLAPHREQLKTSVLKAAVHTNTAYLQPLTAAAAANMQHLTAAAAANMQHVTVWAAANVDTAKAQFAAASAAAEQQLQSALLQAHERWPGVLPPWLLHKAAGSSARSHGKWSVDNLSSILPDGSQWSEVAADIADKLQTPPAQRNHKAPALLLACGSADDCNEAAAALAVLPPKGEACSLAINSADLHAAHGTGEPAAALQAKLAPFLKRCPAGLVVLREVEALPVAAIPALHNALSELGGFQHDGAVDGSKAAYALLLQLHPAKVAAAAAAADAAAADAAIKDAFFGLLNAGLGAARAAEAEAESAHWAAVERAINTLHRRIEFAAPVRLGPSSEAALDEGVEEGGDDAQFDGDDDTEYDAAAAAA